MSFKKANGKFLIGADAVAKTGGPVLKGVSGGVGVGIPLGGGPRDAGRLPGALAVDVVDVEIFVLRHLVTLLLKSLKMVNQVKSVNFNWN